VSDDDWEVDAERAQMSDAILDVGPSSTLVLKMRIINEWVYE